MVDGGGAAEEDGAGGTDGRGPDITDTRLIGLRIYIYVCQCGKKKNKTK
jgi:hypothetical protein